MLSQEEQDYEARNPVEYKHEMPGLPVTDKITKECNGHPPPLAPQCFINYPPQTVQSVCHGAKDKQRVENKFTGKGLMKEMKIKSG
jgi:hypothetical protein